MVLMNAIKFSIEVDSRAASIDVQQKKTPIQLVVANKCMQTKWPNSKVLGRYDLRQAELLWQNLQEREP